MHSATKTTVLIALVMLFSAFSYAADRRFEKKFTVQPGGTLRLSTDMGSVQVTGNSGNEVSVVAELRGRERDINDFEITADQSGSDVKVEGRGKRGRISSFFGFGSNNLDIRYTISVPNEYNLELQTSGGNVSIGSMKGNVAGTTSGGDMRVTGVQGPVRFTTSGGNLHAEGITGKLDMETSGGNIDVANIAGDVELSTSGGNVRLRDVDGMVRAGTSGGDISVKLRGANRGVYVETSGGNIDVAMAKNSGAELDASTSGGEVTCDLPITMSGKIREDRIKGTVNGGGATVRARTSGGNIVIHPLD